MKTFLKIFVGFILSAGLFTFAFYRTPQERAFKQYSQAAATGDVTAALEIARAYANGTGTRPNTALAIEWYRQATARGSAQAAFELAQLYTQDNLADAQAALTYLQAAAQAGHIPAQLMLGNWYELGTNVPQHEGQALFWYQQASQNANAQAKLEALRHQNPALYESVLQFVQTLQAAHQKDPQTQLAAGQAYRQGNPILRDDQTAAIWFKKSWENGQNPQAAFELSDQYAKGEGVERDETQAAAWLARAAQLNNPSAQYQLGEQAYADNPPRFADAFAWFSNAAAQGHAPAQYMTGFMLLQGIGTEKSLPLALRFFEQPAQQNNASAQYVLRQIYVKGLGIKADVQTGRRWLERAAENGNQSAAALLAA